MNPSPASGRDPNREAGVIARSAWARTGRLPTLLLGLAALLLIVGGCAYFNALYNANRAWDEGEAARLRGADGRARQEYRNALAGAARSYRRDPDGRWSDDALYMIGRAHARLGDQESARAALEEVIGRTDDPSLRAGARVHLASVLLAQGREEEGLGLLDAALEEVDDDALRAEGLLARASLHLRSGRTEEGWRDLDRAEELSGAVRIPVAVERTRWGVRLLEFERAARGGRTLLEVRGGENWGDSLIALAESAATLGGTTEGVRLLDGVEDSPWPRQPLDRVRLARADLLARAGDRERALALSRQVAAGVGALADRARIQQARWRLEETASLDELEAVRALLLPAVGSATAVEMIGRIGRVGLMVDRASRRNESHPLFAAAELVRDSLGAPPLARTLLRLYADRERGGAFEGKALLAVLALEPPPEEAREIRARLAEIPENSYLRAARGEDPDDFTILERRLDQLLAQARRLAASEAQFRDVAVTTAARQLDSIRITNELRRRIEAGDSALLDSIRADSLRVDSIQLDSILRADSIGISEELLDSILGDSMRVWRERRGIDEGEGAGSSPSPVLVRLRPAPVPGGHP